MNRQIALHELMLDALGITDRTAALEAADALSAALPPDAKLDEKDVEVFDEHLKAVADLAGAYALLGPGHRNAYALSVARAEAMAGELPPRERAAAWLWIAGAKARAGDKAGVARTVALAKGAFDLSDVDEDTFYQQPAFGYLEAGDLDAAVAEAEAISREEPNLRNWPYTFICPALARTGRYAEAERAAARMTSDAGRLRVYRAIVIERVRAGELNGLAKWIDARETPNERALLDLAAAQQMLGLEGTASLRHLRLHDKWRM